MAFTLDSIGSYVGTDQWNLGIGAVGNIFLWFILAIFFGGLIAAGIGFWYIRRDYKYRIVIVGKVGNNVMEKHFDWARRVPVGKAGDYLFQLMKWKRLMPPPILWINKNKAMYFEREDLELINIAYEDLNEKQRELGIKFVDTDMRMQRIGIEKTLMHRHQKEGFWEKHGQTIVNIAFYIIVTMMMIVLFVQWRKTAQAIGGAVNVAGEVLKEVRNEVSPHVPSEEDTISGLIPTLILVGINHVKIKKMLRRKIQ